MSEAVKLATEVGALVENWMSNPPRPGLYYMTAEQLERFAALAALRAQPDHSELVRELRETAAWCGLVVEKELMGRAADALEGNV